MASRAGYGLIGIAAACAALAACDRVEAPPASPAVEPVPEALRPKPAPRLYRSADKSILFPTPAGSTYCPKPDDWVGSDHGTVVFLTPPERCDRSAAYPSSERGALTAPNIQIFYAWDVLEPEEKPAPPPCEPIGTARFLGDERPLCVRRRGDIVEVRAAAPYLAEGGRMKAEAAFTLVTAQPRLTQDLETFRTLLARTRLCTPPEFETVRPTATAPACPAEAEWF